MSKEREQSDLHQRVLTLAGIAALLFSARYASAIVVPFLLALFFAVIALGPIEWLKKRGMPAGLAMGIVIMMVIGVIVFIAVMLGASVDQFSQAMPGYQKSLEEKTQTLMTWLDGHGVNISKTGIQELINPGMAMRFANSMLGSFAGVMSNALLIIFTVMMMLVEADGFPRKLLLMRADSGELAVIGNPQSKDSPASSPGRRRPAGSPRRASGRCASGGP